MDEIYSKLTKPFPEEAIQRTKSVETHRGYDTTGIGYQYVVDRLNETVGINGWGFYYELVKEIEGRYKDRPDGSQGMPFHDVTVRVSMWVVDKENLKSCAGGHIAAMYGDALKGAITSALKKTAALYGVGAEAYRGAIDEDNKPLPGSHSDRNNSSSSSVEWVRSSTKPNKEQAATFKSQGIGKWTKEGDTFVWWWRKGWEGGTAQSKSGDYFSAEQAVNNARTTDELAKLTKMIEQRTWKGEEKDKLIALIDDRMANMLVSEFKGEVTEDASFPT
jgi:hypothetical protein